MGRTGNIEEPRLLAALAARPPRYRRTLELQVPEFSPETFQPTGSNRVIPVYTPAEPTQQWEINPPEGKPESVQWYPETEPPRSAPDEPGQPLIETDTEPARSAVETAPAPRQTPALPQGQPKSVRWYPLPAAKYEGMLAGPPGWEQPARTAEELGARNRRGAETMGKAESTLGAPQPWLAPSPEWMGERPPVQAHITKHIARWAGAWIGQGTTPRQDEVQSFLDLQAELQVGRGETPLPPEIRAHMAAMQAGEPTVEERLFSPFVPLHTFTGKEIQQWFRPQPSGAPPPGGWKTEDLKLSDEQSAATAQLLNTAKGLVEFMETPFGGATAGVGLAGGPIAHRLIGLGFAIDMAGKLPEQVRQQGELEVNGTLDQKWAGRANLLVSAGIITAGSAKAGSPGLRTEISRALATPEVQALEAALKAGGTRFEGWTRSPEYQQAVDSLARAGGRPVTESAPARGGEPVVIGQTPWAAEVDITPPGGQTPALPGQAEPQAPARKAGVAGRPAKAKPASAPPAAEPTPIPAAAVDTALLGAEPSSATTSTGGSAASPDYAATGGGELGITPPVADNPAFSLFDAVPLELPEAVSLLKSMLGAVPKLKDRLRALGVRALGVFHFNEGPGAKGRIELRRDLFELLTKDEKRALHEEAVDWARQSAGPGDVREHLVQERYEHLLREASMAARNRNPIEAMKTIWHEIGHVVGWLPDKFLRGRGNIFGHIASLKKYLESVLPLDPNRPAGLKLTTEEVDALRAKAQAQMREELGPIEEIVEKILVEEPELRITGITPADVKNLLGIDAREKLPELYNWFASQSDAVKADVLRKAMRGLLDERLAALGKTEKIGSKMVEKTIRKKVGREPTPEEIAARFRVLFRAELEKRNLADLKEIKAELAPMIAWWRGTEKMEDYFKAPAEMYAEAFSVLMNNPAAVAQRAPSYYRLFFNYMDRKPEFRALYDGFQEQVKAGTIMDRRVRDLRESWNQDNTRSMARLRQQFKQNARDFLDNITYHVDRRLGPIYRIAKGSVREGRVRAALGNFTYRASEHERFVATMNRLVGGPLVRSNLDWNDLGELLFHQRVSQERLNIANPGGWTPKNSLERLNQMREQLGPQRWTALDGAAKAFRATYETIVLRQLHEARMFTPEQQNVIDNNVWYATFQALREPGASPIERLLDASFGAGIGPRIYRQVGNLGEIKQPATATVLKALSLITAAHRNIAKRETVQLLLSRQGAVPFSGAEIQLAQRHWTGRRNEWVIKDTDRVGTIVYMEDGKPKAYYVRKVIADALEYGNPIENRLFAGVVSAVNWLKAGFTQLNYGFWPVNFLRDTGAFWLNMPGLAAPIGWARALPKAIAAARDSVRGARANPHADAFLARRMAISRADPRGVWSNVDNEYDLKVASYGANPAQWNRELGKVNLLVRAWNGYREVGQILERVNKIAGMLYLDRAFPNMPEWKKAQVVRERAGSPNFLERGASNAAVDLFAMFYNPWKEAIRSTFHAAQENPWSFGAKVSGLIAAPSMIQAAASIGWMGPGLQKQYASISDYDLANYLNIPLGWTDDDQERIAYLRLPLPEPARILHGLLTQAVTRRGEGITSYMGGQVPSPNAMLGVAAAWANWQVYGQNPYDPYRGKNILTDTQAEAGGWQATRDLAKWTWNELGGSLFHRFQNEQLDTPPAGDVAKFLRLPIVNNAIGRWIKVSDRGLVDANRRETQDLIRQRARIRLGVQEVMRKLVGSEPFTDSEKVLLRDPYAQSYLYDSLPRILIESSSGVLHRLGSAQSREEKLLILRKELERKELPR